MARTLEEINEYYKNQGRINSIIKNDLVGDDEIVYGARSLNAHFPSHLDKPTEDWDILSKTPKKAAFEAEKKLDKGFGGDYFETKKAVHPGTWKIKSKITNRGVADFTKQEKEVKYKTIGSIRYATLENAKQNIKKSLSDPESHFRHDKDKEARQRINIYEKKYKIRPQIYKKRSNKRLSLNLFSGRNLFR